MITQEIPHSFVMPISATCASGQPLQVSEGNFMEGITISKWGIIWKDGIELAQYDNGKGYMFVVIDDNQYYVHRLVAMQFIPNPENKPQVNHKNGIKCDNWSGNLEWATNSENGKHAYATGLNYVSEYQKQQTSIANSGEKSHLSKLTAEKVIEIRKLYSEGKTQKEIGAIYGLTRATIGYVVTRKTWKHID